MVVTVKVGDMEENIRKERIRRVRKEVAGYVQYVVGNKKFCIKLKYGHLEDMITIFLTVILDEEEAEKGGDKL